MNQLSTSDRVQVISALVEGCSIRAAVRMTGVAKNTVVKLLAGLGQKCLEYHDAHVQNLKSKRVQMDEIWSFCHSKEQNVKPENWGKGHGDVWTWVALDGDSKLVTNWHVGGRDQSAAQTFVADLASRLTDRIQLTSDGWGPYRQAVKRAFGNDVDYAMLVKEYATVRQGYARYSPPECISTHSKVETGYPAEKHICTSFVERQNLTMRMGMRRFTRLTNGFSKKLENLKHNVALHFMHYNFCRVHQTLRVTPAMESGLTDHVWEIEELVALLG